MVITSIIFTFVVFFFIILPILLSRMFISSLGPSPYQLADIVKANLLKAQHDKDLYQSQINESATLLKQYLFNNTYCKVHADSLNQIFYILEQNPELMNAVFGDITIIEQRKNEIIKMKEDNDSADCGCSSSCGSAK